MVGVDEVGRGALAGPVVVGAVFVPLNFKYKFKGLLRDSKKLSLKQREEWFSFIKEKKIRYAISFVSPKIVDRLNVTGAVNLGALRVVKKINSKVFDKYRLVVDKGIKIKGFEFESYIKADENFPAVSLASIVAKVYRDRYMRRVSRVFRKYGFESHVGYGTKKHIEVIVKYGALDIHRKSFIEKFLF